MAIPIILIIIGFILLIKGADVLVNGSTALAKKFHISEIVIGLTVVAMGTSMPELVVSLTSAIEGHADISLGNVVGSNLANLLLILGICAMIRNIEIKKETRVWDSPINLGVTILLIVLGNIGLHALQLDRIEGIIFLILFLIFIGYVVFMAKRGEEPKEKIEDSLITQKNHSISTVRSILSILLGIVALKFGADFVVNNSVTIAEMLGISEKIIGLTIIAVGTSLPELVASVTAMVKGESDMAIGNVLGSNIFNILLILGVSGTISPIQYSLTYNLDIIILIVGSLLLLVYPYIGKKNYMTRTKGSIFVAMYMIYMITLLLIR